MAAAAAAASRRCRGSERLCLSVCLCAWETARQQVL